MLLGAARTAADAAATATVADADGDESCVCCGKWWRSREGVCASVHGWRSVGITSSAVNKSTPCEG